MPLGSKQQPVSSTYMIRFIIGLTAICLPGLASYLSGEPLIPSISASYYAAEAPNYAGDWPRNIFVGCLFAISALFVAYNGENRREFYLSKVAAVAAFFVATFPERQPHFAWVHGLASVIMFSVLAMFCYQFYKSARSKPFPEAKVRAFIYAACGGVIVLSVALVAINSVIKDTFLSKIDRLIFYCEASGLLAFGIAWFVASRIIPMITHDKERVWFSRN